MRSLDVFLHSGPVAIASLSAYARKPPSGETRIEVRDEREPTKLSLDPS
jgi:hypothetical protein